MVLFSRFATLALLGAFVLSPIGAGAAERSAADTAMAAIAVPQAAVPGHLFSKNDNDNNRQWSDDRREGRADRREHRRDWRDDRRDRRENWREREKDRREAAREWRKDRREAKREWRKDRRRWEKVRRDHRRDLDRAYREGYWDARRESRYRYRNPYGYRVGHYIDQPRYVVVDDYRDYGWRRPPAGYGYVNLDGDIFLVALATGLIVSALNQ